MANKITDMSKIRKVIKFHCIGKSKFVISNCLSLSRNKVKKYISLFEVFAMPLEQINKKTDAELETFFFVCAKFQYIQRFLSKVNLYFYKRFQYIYLNCIVR